MDDVSHLQRDGVRQTISLVVPVYNELGAIEPFLAAVERVMGRSTSTRTSFLSTTGRRTRPATKSWTSRGAMRSRSG